MKTKKKKRPNSKIKLDKPPKQIQLSKRTKASRVTDFNIHVRSTVPQDVPPDQYCNGPTYKGLCKHVAGHNTDHKGVGRCRIHDSRTPASVKSQSLSRVRNRYGGGVPTNLKSRYEELMLDDGLLQVTDEIAASKAVLSRIIENVDDVDFTTEEGQDKAMKLIKALDSVTKLNIKYTEVQRKSEFVITLPQFMNMVTQIVEIVKGNCAKCDPVTRQTLMRRMAVELDITGRSKMAEEGAVEASYDVEGE